MATRRPLPDWRASCATKGLDTVAVDCSLWQPQRSDALPLIVLARQPKGSIQFDVTRTTKSGSQRK